MSAVLGRPPTALTHEINPYLPDILRPSGIGSISSRQTNGCSPIRHTILSSFNSTPDSTGYRTNLLPHHPQESLSNRRPSPPICGRCQDPIRDNYLYHVRGQTWHEACAVCSTCSTALSDVCFLHGGHLYCRRDYDRLHATRCINCRQPMRSHELSMTARRPDSKPTDPADLIFHVSCFTCAVCQQPLAAGDQYVIDPTSQRPICRADFLAFQNGTVPCRVENSSDTAEQPTPASGFPGRRMRTSLTDEQRLHLQKAYDVNPRPQKHVRDVLAKEISVPVRVVQVWFQNQRARDKRNSLQQRQSKFPPKQTHLNSYTAVRSSRSPSPSTVATPSPRTSVESGPLLDFGGYSCDPGISIPNESQSEAWIPAALENSWFTRPSIDCASTMPKP